jgi:hypothetical protein
MSATFSVVLKVFIDVLLYRMKSSTTTIGARPRIDGQYRAGPPAPA